MSRIRSCVKHPGRQAPPRSRTAATLFTSVAALAALISVSAVAFISLPRAPDPPVISGRTAITWLARAGVTPRNLAAAGANATSGGAAITAASVYLAEHLATLESTDNALATARGAYERTVDRVQSGRATSEETASLSALRTTYDTARTQADTSLSALRAAALAGLTQNQRGTIDAILANRKWGLPVQYAVANRTEAEWIALRDALANVRIASQRGEDPDAACRATVTAANVNDVRTAAENLQSNLGSLHATWNAANTP